MRISELTRRTGVSASAIKYYVREGLLTGGERTSANQVSYEEYHVHRLTLIRALIEVGELSVADTRALIGAIDAKSGSVHNMLGDVQRAVMRSGRIPGAGARDPAHAQLAELARRRNWSATAGAREQQALVALLSTARSLGHDDVADLLDDYADAAARLAGPELDWVGRGGDPDSLAERAVVGTVLGDAMLAALRRLAQANESARRFGTAKLNS